MRLVSSGPASLPPTLVLSGPAERPPAPGADRSGGTTAGPRSPDTVPDSCPLARRRARCSQRVTQCRRRLAPAAPSIMLAGPAERPPALVLTSQAERPPVCGLPYRCPTRARWPVGAPAVHTVTSHMVDAVTSLRRSRSPRSKGGCPVPEPHRGRALCAAPRGSTPMRRYACEKAPAPCQRQPPVRSGGGGASS